MKSDRTVLAGRIKTELAELEYVIIKIERLLTKFHQHNDADYLDGVALNLHGFYSGAEKIFEEIAKEVDETLPGGAEWHRYLLVQMSSEISHKRPSVISRETRNCLDEYRGFRHVVRNIYSFNLRASRLQELAEEVSGCYQQLSQDLANFVKFLEDLDSIST